MGLQFDVENRRQAKTILVIISEVSLVRVFRVSVNGDTEN